MLRCSAIAQWAKIMAIQLSNPVATNEKMTRMAPKYLQAVVGLVTEAAAKGRLKEFGGQEKVAEFLREVEVGLVSANSIPRLANSTQNCYNVLKRRYPRMNLRPLLQAITSLSG